VFRREGYHCAISKRAEGLELEELDGVKAWVWGLIGGPLVGLLIWYFKRSTNQSDKRLDGLEADLEEVREVLAKKITRDDLEPLWQRLEIQNQDIKNLGATFSRELREQIDTLRRESNDHQRQTNERLDRLFMVINKGPDK
jgi:hypothetical protein